MKPILLTSLFLSLGVPSYAKPDIHTCLLSSRIESLSPNTEAYTTGITPLNLRLPVFPAAIAIPSYDAQVSAAVKCATRHSLKVQALSGGHSYGNFGLGGVNGSLVIDMRRFNSLKVDRRRNMAVIGAGKRLGDVALGLYEQGGRDIPHGVCGGVGLGGHATHGGFGFTSRMWGTTLDVVTGMDVVLASGERKFVDKRTDPDLFWALRGAGDSFGIVTRFHVRTLLAPEIGTIFSFNFPSLKTAEDRISIFTAVQNYAITAPAKFHIRVFSVPDLRGYHPLAPEQVFTVSGVYWGPQQTYESLIAPLVPLFPNDTVHEYKELPYITALESFDNYAPLAQKDPYVQQGATFFTKSLMTPEPFTPAAISSFFNFLAAPTSNLQTPVFWYVIHDLYGGIHSKIGEYSLDSASYAGRNALWTLQLYSTPVTFAPPYPEEGFAFMQRMVESITKVQPETEFAAYPNYVDPSLEKEEALRLYYGVQLERLKKIKRRVDRREVFWNPQSVSVGRG